MRRIFLTLILTAGCCFAQDSRVHSLTATGDVTAAGKFNGNIQQRVTNQAFVINDFSGCAHFFISGTAPYTNTFLGCGAGSTFIGSHQGVTEATGSMFTDGVHNLYTASHTLPNTFANDSAGGFGWTTNAGTTIQFTNGGLLVINGASIGSAAAISSGGTSASTGGISIFTGAAGAANEMFAVYPADGSTGATRVFALSGRTRSTGFLSGVQNWGITNSGTATGLAIDASEITTGALAAARGGAGTITGALKGNGAGVVSQAACADLSNGAASCSTDTTNASNISAGTLASARGGAGAITGALKGNGAGVVSQAACADLSNGAASCSTDTTNATNITSGTLANGRLPTTMTGIRITPRQVSMADATSVTPTSDTADINTFTSTQVAGTLTVNAPSGTPTDGQKLVLRLKSTNAQTYSFNATYAFSTTVTAPVTLAAGKTDYIGLMWNATNTKWDVVATDQGH